MSPLIEEARKLLRIASRDLLACDALLGAQGLDDSVAAFHAQQAAEKALKAVLVAHGFEVRRTHDLEELASRLSAQSVEVPVSEGELTKLTPYAVASRYEEAVPGLLTGVEARRMAAILVGWAGTCLQGKTRD